MNQHAFNLLVKLFTCDRFTCRIEMGTLLQACSTSLVTSVSIISLSWQCLLSLCQLLNQPVY